MYTEKVKITYLDSNDITGIVAEKFGVSSDHVEVEISEDDDSVCAIIKELIE